MAFRGLLDGTIISPGVDASTVSNGSDINPVDSDNGQGPNPGGVLLTLLGWTMAEVTEFQTIWHTIKSSHNDDLMGLGIDIIIWILETIPDAKAMFDVYAIRNPLGSRMASSRSKEKFNNHAKNVGSELDKLVNSLSDPPLAHHYLSMLAKDHIGRKVQVHHMEKVRDRFHRFLYDLNGYERDSRASEMWYQFLDAFLQLYKELIGFEEQGKEEKKPECSCCTVL